jgi:thioesterase domain-containing protein
MTFNEFLEELNQKSIKIVFTDGKLKYEGPEKNITPELIAILKEHKESLIRYLWPQECPNMMPINPVGTKIPFILIYFEVMNYALSEYLGKDQPFYGFLHYGSRGEKINYKSVESFAADYIIQLQKVIPKGPYFLGGFSFGGILAFEMAIQLQKAGHEVPFITMLDSIAPSSFGYIMKHSNIYNLVKSRFLGPTRRKLEMITKISICNIFFLLRKPVPVFLRNYYIVHKYSELALKYKPGKFKGELLLFKSLFNNCDFKYNGWESYVDKVNMVTFKGEHLAIAREKKYAEMIGTEIMNHLTKVYKHAL